MVESLGLSYALDKETIVEGLRAKMRHTIEKSKKKFRSENPEISSGTQITGYRWIFSPQYQAFPLPSTHDDLHPIPQEIERWQLLDIDVCRDALDSEWLDIEVFTGRESPERLAFLDGTAVTAATATDNRETQKDPLLRDSSARDLPAAKNLPCRSNQLRNIIRPLLLDTIKKAIGREIVPRNRHPIDPRQDDEGPPNLYKWRFSAEYPRFPGGGATKWSMIDCEACIEAISKGWLSVTALPSFIFNNESVDAKSNAATQHQAARNPFVPFIDDTLAEGHHPSSEERALSHIQSVAIYAYILSAIRHQEIDQLVLSLDKEARTTDNISSLRESYSNIEHLILERQAAVKDVGDSLEIQMRNLSSVKDDVVSHAKASIARLENTTREQDIQLQQLKVHSEELQKELTRASEKISDLENKLGHPVDEVAEARRLGEVEDLRTAIQDLREERDSQFQRHLAQLRKVREDSRLEGFRQGEASVIRKSDDAIIVVDLKTELEETQAGRIADAAKAREHVAHLRQQLDDMHARNLIEVAKAREEGRHEDEQLSRLLEGQNVNCHGRKRREMRTIYHNWKNVPQNILPKSMMPKGIMPSDRTLILLARLSRVSDDPQKATTLLEREIKHRNAQLLEERRDFTVTNGDIDKVLASLGDEASSQRASEISSAPQPVSHHHTTQSVNDLNQSDVPTRRDRNRNCVKEPHSRATTRSQEQKSERSNRSLNYQSRASLDDVETEKLSRRFTDVRDIARSIPGNGPQQPPLIPSWIRSAIPQRQSIMTNVDLPNFSSSAGSNLDNDSFDSPSRFTDLSMMPAGATEIPGREAIIRSIHDEIEALPLPANSLAPSSPKAFPMDFLQEFIRGDNATFAKCSRTMRHKQVVDWPEMIKLNPKTHPLCPSVGTNGALTFVDGRPNTGEIGMTYPTLLRETAGFYQYIGHYKVVKRIIMPVEIWKACPDDERIGVIDEIENKEWGQTLLSFKGLCTNATDKQEKRINDVLNFFERPGEPCLRMSWTLLQFVSFELEDYKVLSDAMEEFEREHRTNEDAASVASETTSKAVVKGTQRLDQLQPSREDVQTSTPKHFDNINAFISELAARSTKGDANRPVKVRPMHTPTTASTLTNNDSPPIHKVPASIRTTIPSSTSDSNNCTSPEYLSQAEDGRWQVHTNRGPHASDWTTPNPKLHSGELSTISLSAKREREEEEDIYGVSPPPQSQQASGAQANIAKAPRRSLQEILASFSNPKRRRLDDLNKKIAGE